MGAGSVPPRVNMPRTGVEPVKIITPFLKLVFYAGKLSDVMYVPPWRSIHGGIVMISIIYRNQAYHPS